MAKDISLQDFFEKDLKKYSDELLYLRAVKFCREAPPEMRGPLYYALLNWKDCHPEIQQRCIELSKAYEVRWTEKDKPEVYHYRYFYAMYSDTYQKDAREVYNSITNSDSTRFSALTPIYVGELIPYLNIDDSLSDLPSDSIYCKKGKLIPIKEINYKENSKHESC